MFVAHDTTILGYITFGDTLKDASRRAIERLHTLGVRVAMITGDSKQVADGVARELGIDTYFAEAVPTEKYTYVRALQEKGNVVVMVGDGVNDAPALTQADVGIAVGSGTDVAVEAGDIVLLRSDPEDVARSIMLARRVYTKMVQNLVWALGYNVVAIPAGAGVFAYWGVFLSPHIGALVMSLSTIIVVVNAFLLKRFKLT